QAGAFEYLPKPFDVQEAIDLLNRALLEREAESVAPIDNQKTNEHGSDMIGASPQIQEVFRLIGRLSSSSINVLIRGASGVGKELVARALHDSSPRSSKPFIEINTGAIPADLLESELFGHEKGAFTGAVQRRKGRFEQADGGTLFLDEIGDMPAELQARLLRVLSEKKFYRVGGTEQLLIDVRVIAATNQDLEVRVNQGLFRLDLFHRLNVVEIHVPNLNERESDSLLLAEYFLTQAAAEFDMPSKSLSVGVKNCLSGYSWPGNVRELENLCRRVTVTAPGQIIELPDLPAVMRDDASAVKTITGWQSALRQQTHALLLRGQSDINDTLQPQIEKILIETALEFSEGHKQKAAKLLGWGRNTLTRKMKELVINQ
ncbi:MAG: two-component system nitrogen regulation response regulator GlnG, partial [Parvicella sp.]